METQSTSNSETDKETVRFWNLHFLRSTWEKAVVPVQFLTENLNGELKKQGFFMPEFYIKRYIMLREKWEIIPEPTNFKEVEKVWKN